MSSTAWVIIAFVLYFGGIFLLAIRFRKAQNVSDYFLGNRTLGPWVSALSAQASDMSGWLLMGLPGAVFLAGIGRLWMAIGLTIGTALNWFICAKRIRRYTIIAGNSITLPEFLGNRFRDKSGSIKIVAALFFTVFFTLYVASGFIAGGTLLYRLFGMSYHTGLVVTAVFILGYTFLGGFLAVAWTDLIQGILMLVAIIAIPLIALSLVDGGLSAIPAEFLNMATDGAGYPLSWVAIVSDLSWGLGYFGMPHVIVRFMAIRSEKEVTAAATIGAIWVAIALGFAVLVGLVGFVLVPDIANPETVFIEMIKYVFLNEGAPIAIPILGGLFLTGIFAAIKSSADSQILVSSSAVTNDIYKQLKPDAAEDKLVWGSRISVAVIAVVGFVIAWTPGGGIMQIVGSAWAGLGSAFAPLVLLSIFWRRINLAGGITGIIAGGSLVLFWDFVNIGGQTLRAQTGMFPLVPGFIVSFLLIIIVSLLTKEPSQEIYDDFEKAQQVMDI